MGAWEPDVEPWGLIEMQIQDRDGVRIVLVEVPPQATLSAMTRDPLRRRGDEPMRHAPRAGCHRHRNPGGSVRGHESKHGSVVRCQRVMGRQTVSGQPCRWFIDPDVIDQHRLREGH